MRAVAALVILLLWAHPAAAKTLYVNPSHGAASDATTYAANDAAHPWVTLSRALRGETSCAGSGNSAEAATAGDIVEVSAGTYSCAGRDSYIQLSFWPINEGTNATTGLLTIRCETRGECTLSQSSTWGPLYGCVGTGTGASGQDYILWDGFVADPNAVVGSDTAPVLLRYSTGCRIEFNTITFNGDGGKGIPRKTDPAHSGPDGRLYEPLNLGTCTAASPTVCSVASGTHYFDDQSGDNNLIYLSGNSQLPDGLYFAISSDGCCRYPFVSNTAFMLIEAEPLGFSGGHATLGSAGTGGTFVHLQDDTNSSGIRLETTVDAIIKNNTVRNFYAGSNPINGNCIETYHADSALYEDNDLSECGAGIHLKGATVPDYQGQGQIVRRNKIYSIGVTLNDITGGSGTTCTNFGVASPCIWPLARDFGYGPSGAGLAVFVGAIGTSGEPVRIYQNIIYGSDVDCVQYRSLNDPGTPQHVKLVNNVFDSCAIGMAWRNTPILVTGAALVVQNNIFSNIAEFVYDLELADATLNVQADILFEHNRYALGDWPTFARTGTGNKATLASWTTDLSNQDDDAVSSGTGDPSFVNVATRDYRLQGGSDALDDGVDLLDLDGDTLTNDVVPIGAYITGSETIGGGSGAVVTVPDAPTIGTATAGNAQCSVAFTPPGDDGGSTITGYTATSTPGSFTGTAASSPITVTGLSNGTGYTFTVYATNAEGNSTASSASNTCTPSAVSSGGVRLRLRGE